jgi:hypothetical protein
VLGALARAEKAEDAHRQAEARLARAIRGTSDGPWERPDDVAGWTLPD